MQATFSRSKVDVAAVHLDTPAPFGRRILDLPALDALDGPYPVYHPGPHGLGDPTHAHGAPFLET